MVKGKGRGRDTKDDIERWRRLVVRKGKQEMEYFTGNKRKIHVDMTRNVHCIQWGNLITFHNKNHRDMGVLIISFSFCYFRMGLV